MEPKVVLVYNFLILHRPDSLNSVCKIPLKIDKE